MNKNNNKRRICFHFQLPYCAMSDTSQRRPYWTAWTAEAAGTPKEAHQAEKNQKRITYSVNTAGPLLLRTTSDNGISFQAGSAERTDVCNCSCQHNDCVELSKEGGGGEGGLDLGSLPQLLLNCLWLNGGKHHRSETDWRGKVLVGEKNEKNLRQRACLALSVATLYCII